jgi:hypothetical protein
MRRLRRRVREAEKEKLTKLYEQLSANEHGSALPFGQAHSFVPLPAALSQYRKSVGGELSIDEQIGDQRSFATQEAALSEYQKTVREEFSADEQIGEEHSFATQEAASSEGQNVAGELSADEQIQAHSFATHEAGLSEERKNVARESVKKDAVAPGMARIQGQRTGIVTNYVDGALAWQHWFSPQIEMRPEIAYYRSLNADAFNGNAAAGIPPSKNWAVIAASDLIIHF